MTRTQLDELIAQGEGVRLEFKRSISAAHRIARTLVAFANTSGGTLLIGVADNGTIVGVSSATPISSVPPEVLANATSVRAIR